MSEYSYSSIAIPEAKLKIETTVEELPEGLRKLQVVREDNPPGLTHKRALLKYMAMYPAETYVYDWKDNDLFGTALSEAAQETGSQVLFLEPELVDDFLKNPSYHRIDHEIYLEVLSSTIREVGVGLEPKRIWIAPGSCLLARAFKSVWPEAEIRVILDGRDQPELECPEYNSYLYFPNPIGEYDPKIWNFISGARDDLIWYLGSEPLPESRCIDPAELLARIPEPFEPLEDIRNTLCPSKKVKSLKLGLTRRTPVVLADDKLLAEREGLVGLLEPGHLAIIDPYHSIESY